MKVVRCALSDCGSQSGASGGANQPLERKGWHALAFTLIELLVVIAIIAILAAMLLSAGEAESRRCSMREQRQAASLRMISAEYRTEPLILTDPH